jgi:hypothetical protein
VIPGKLYNGTEGFSDAVAAAARDRSAWPAGERAAPERVGARDAADPDAGAVVLRDQ